MHQRKENSAITVEFAEPSQFCR